MFAAPPEIPTRIAFKAPAELDLSERRSDWLDQRGAGPMPWFLEGPSFDREGNLYCVDLAHGRVFRISPGGEWLIFAQYQGVPNGLKLHRDGRIYVADHDNGLLCFDPATGRREVVLDRGVDGKPFFGLNDLCFDSKGNLYLTDQGFSGIEDPYGRVYRLNRSGSLDLLMEGLASPNGLVLDRSETVLHVSCTRSNTVISIPVPDEGARAAKVRTWLHLSGGPAGPDGMAMDRSGRLAVTHAGFGTVWLFDALGEPAARIRSCAGMRTTNVAYGGPGNLTLFITEAEHGAILAADLDVPGEPMFALKEG